MNPEEVNNYEQEQENSPEPSEIEATEINTETSEEVEDKEVVTAEATPESSEEEEVISQETAAMESEVKTIRQQLDDLEAAKQSLTAEIESLEGSKEQISQQIAQMQSNMGQMVESGLQTLQQRQQSLQANVEQLEKRRDRVRQEMRTTFAGASQELAIRVQGFKDYLVGSLQDLAASAEQLELPTYTAWENANQTPEATTASPQIQATDKAPIPQFTKRAFQEQTRQIREIITQYRTLPDYYGSPWQLRRTFEPIHAEKVESWFFTQGGRGALESMGSRLQNILVASAVISITRQLYGDRLRTLVLANSPERLGEWRRGLQDCLGISRVDFGPERGVVLFETAEATAQKAERLQKEEQLSLIVIDSTDAQVSLSLLQFPLWLAFIPDPQQISSYVY